MLLIGTVLVIFVATLVWPVWRLWRATGRFAIVGHHDPVGRVMGALLAVWLLAVLVWAIGLEWLGPAALDVWSAPRAIRLAGWALVALGVIGTAVAQWQMGASWRIGIDERPTELVTGGVFRVVRNPIYAALLVGLAGVVLVTPSPWTVVGWVGAAQLLLVQVRFEEQHLERLHGAKFRAWAARVGRFLPGVGRLA
jgi:protein-S-isoprenylcysteine O-methyltransferase Ste14